MEHVSSALRRGLARVQRRNLAPLNPQAFLLWVWNQGDRRRGTQPLTVEDVWFERGRREPGLTLEEVRRSYVGEAAWFRRCQRLGLDPWTANRRLVASHRGE